MSTAVAIVLFVSDIIDIMTAPVPVPSSNRFLLPDLLISEIAKRSSMLAGLIVSIPLTTFLAMIWLYWESQETQKIIDLSVPSEYERINQLLKIQAKKYSIENNKLSILKLYDEIL